ncbi:hypothetical protein [Notoacmeibacter ruber]|uniref:Uncharacterized protein n=1 Tax=Notoacmeibacter ruber TaxID=2670375 RepID=A0A3L7JCT7_9HYPH|nr:hypothetical protein [Notoacmeibacter ruber]RLQ88486.1 hypothetical protein D8780_09975 [Notoacmeibacter ruber]
MTDIIASQCDFGPGFLAHLYLDDEKTPAEEFEKDRKKKGEMSEDEEVEEGLEESFPASDPISPTRPDKPAGAAD